MCLLIHDRAVSEVGHVRRVDLFTQKEKKKAPKNRVNHLKMDAS